ncbi:MAG: hypothetical protein PHX53_00880 [Syntrophales bacterium]|nr:hypothetical protein [Syntrophales bacterium]
MKANHGSIHYFQSQGPLTAAGFFCVVLLLLSGLVSWLYLPIEGRVSGLRLPLLSSWFINWPHIPSLTLFSYGGITLALGLSLLILSLTPWRRRPLPWLTLSLIIWVLGCGFLLRLANRLDDLAYLWDQRQQLDTLLAFARKYCGARYWQPSAVNFDQMGFRLHSLAERLAWNRDFLSWGVLCLFLGGGLTLALGILRLPSSRRKWGFASWALLLGLIVASVSVVGVVRDQRLQQASDAISQGEYDQARQRLYRLGESSPDLWGWPPFLNLLGEAQHELGLATPEQHFFMGARLMPRDLTAKKSEIGAVGQIRFELSRAAEASSAPSIRGTARQLEGWALVINGIQKYHAKKAIAAALDSWAQAGSVSSGQLQIPLLLTKARTELRVSPDALADARAFLDVCNHRYLKSLTHTLAGDSYYHMRDFSRARKEYLDSFTTYHFMNYRPFKGLSGQ